MKSPLKTERQSSKEPTAAETETDGLTKARMESIVAYDAPFASTFASELFTKALCPGVGLVQMAEVVRNSIEKVQTGDMSGMEAMLVGQAHALQQVFANLMRRAGSAQQAKQYQMYMGMGLKAQAQSRATISALVDLKYPRQATFVKQANIAHGPQQVNNGWAPAGGIAHAEQTQPTQNELLEHQHANTLTPRVDTRAAQASEPSHSALGTVEQVHRAAKPRG